MSTYLRPGVYIEEISKLPPSVAEVETAIPAFIGYTYNRGRTGSPMQSAVVEGYTIFVEVARISSMLEYENIFGKPDSTSNSVITTVTILDNMEGTAVKKRTASASYMPDTAMSFGAMYYQVQMYFANGGGPCYIVSVGQDYNDEVVNRAYIAGLQIIEKYDEPTLLVFPDAFLLPPAPADPTALNAALSTWSNAMQQYLNTFNSTLLPAQQAYNNDTNEPKTPSVVSALNAARVLYMGALNSYKQATDGYKAARETAKLDLQSAGIYYGVMDKALQQCAKLKDRFVIMDCYGDNIGKLRQTDLGTDTGSLRYGAAYHPFLITSPGLQFDNYNSIYVDHRQDTNGNGVFDIPVVHGTSVLLGSATNTEIYNVVKQALDQMPVILSPSAAIAGVYATVDSARGVWKAPANVGLSYVTDVTHRVSDAEQEGLNDDPLTGKSINVIRNFSGKGTLVWGARTLDANSKDWRYISVRRLFIMIEESLRKATNAFALEPNDQAIWLKVQSMIENYLTTLWRAGALQGARAKDAFYVSVGLGKTMSMQDVLDGRMFIEVGIAAVRPAEFIVLQFSHMMARS